MTATQPAARQQHFMDPYQPKLLLAEDSIKPSEDKRPLNDCYGEDYASHVTMKYKVLVGTSLVIGL